MKTDARVRYTKMRIRESMLALLRQKPVNRITVKEICAGAEINRATFYTHYQDAFDLLEKLQDEYVEKLEQNLQVCHGSHSERVEALLRYTLDNKGLLLLLGSAEGNPLWPRLLVVCNAQFQAAFAAAGAALPQQERQLVYRYLLGGSSALMAAWLHDELTATPEQLTKMLLSLSTAVLHRG